MASDLAVPVGATGIGSMPGTSVAEAVAVIAGELPDLPHVPELPARGPGSDMIGRTAVLLSEVWRDLGLDTTPTGWRLTGGSSAALRRGCSWAWGSGCGRRVKRGKWPALCWSPPSGWMACSLLRHCCNLE